MQGYRAGRRWASFFSAVWTAAALSALAEGSLFDPDGFSEPLEDAQRAPRHARARHATLREGALDTLQNARPGDLISISLFEDVAFRCAVTEARRPEAGRVVLSGRLQGRLGGAFAFSITDGVFGAWIQDPQTAVYVVESVEGRVCRVAQMEAGGAPHGGGRPLTPEEIAYHQPVDGLRVLGAAGLLNVEAALPSSGDRVSVVDVLIVYTEEAEIGAGGEAALQNIMTLAMAEANTAYQNSRAHVRLREVFRHRTDYQETASFSTSLDRLKATDDGFMDEVHDLRAERNADVVCLFTQNGDSEFGGLAFTMSQAPTVFFRDFAFAVVRQSAAVGTYTFAHELSHVMGCQHDRAGALDEEGNLLPGAFEFSYGHRFDVGEATLRTVMAVGEGQRIPFFSNPQLVFQGNALGVTSEDPDLGADNTLSLNNAATAVSSFFAPLIQTLPPEVSLLAPEDGRILQPGDSVAIQVAASDPEGALDRVEIYRGDALLTVIPAADLDANGQAVFEASNLEAGEFDVSARAVDELGAVSTTLGAAVIVRPEGDSFDSPIVVTGASPAFTATNRGATAEANEPQHTPNPGQNSVWFSWVAPQAGTVDLVAAGDGFVPLPAVYTGVSIDALSKLNQTLQFSTDNGLLQAFVSFDAAEGETYRLAVAGFEDTSGAFDLSWQFVTAAENDNFENALLLAADVSEVLGDNTGATAEAGEPLHAGNEGGKSLWYEWTPVRSGVVVIEVTALFRPLTDLYLGDSLADVAVVPRSFDFLEVAEGDRTLALTRLTAEVASGERYRLAVDGFQGGDGPFTATFDFPPPPANDLFENAELIVGVDATLESSNLFASRETDEPVHANNVGGKSVWFQWAAPVSGTVFVTSAAADFLPLIDVYQGDVLTDLTSPSRRIVFGEDQLSESLEFTALAFDRYFFAVDGFSNRSGPFTFTLRTENAPPSISAETPPSVNAEGRFAFRVDGSAGTSFTVETSTDLRVWEERLSASFSEDFFLFTDDVSASESGRFYRVRPVR